ncbi:MAG: DUF4012 domain-containing protein [Patescibacteria group bacterium]
MDQIADSINKKNSILLARNSPVALVVGAASFLGSHLVDKLLDKNIQVVGTDDLTASDKRNLRKASENRNFHMVIDSPEKLDLDLPRLDYIFLIPQKNTKLIKVLELFKSTKCRMLLLSSIELYDKSSGHRFGWLKEIEEDIAKFAGDHNLNARILRVGPIFGPRMDFEDSDPIVRLINQALTEDLQKEVSLEFSSRALYVADAVDLTIKTILSGATAQKIFDAVSPTPIKVSEIKQILLDPVWYENKDFDPTELPPWPTPNLDKTIKHLNWHPKHKLTPSLRDTLSYFKDNEIEVPRAEDKKLKLEESMKGELESFKQEVKKEDLPAGRQEIKPEKKKGLPKLAVPWSKLVQLAVVILVTYAFIWPGLILGWGFITYRYNLNQGLESLEKGEFDKSLIQVKQARSGLTAVRSIYEILEPIKATGVLKERFELGDSLIALSSFTASSAENTAKGVQALYQSLKVIMGEGSESPSQYFTTAQVDLSLAGEDISRAHAIISGNNFNSLPKILAEKVSGVGGKLDQYSNLLQKAHTLSILLPKLVALDGSKNYLVLLQNNMELRPTGGFIGSFAKISFEAGKLKGLEVNDIYNIDGNLELHVEPPKEIKEDLGQINWYLRDSNWEPDFPTAARQAEWFYAKETGERVEGTVALDITAVEELLNAVGPLDLPDYNEKITAENLFEKAVSHAETGFFPGSQAKKSFLTALVNELFNKIFFLPGNNWPGIVSALARSLDEKHLSIYLDDTKLFSYLTSEGWTHVLPRASDQNKDRDFLSLVEANLGANKANYYLDRNYKLETVIGKDGEVKHRLRVSYINRSPSDTFPAGMYKNRMRVYLPFGTKLDRVLWAESDITRDVTNFVDYGRSGFSMLLELAPKEQKTLVLDYSVPTKLEFENDKASYRLDIIKQAGILKDPLEWTIFYPIGYQIVSTQAKKIGPQEQTIQTDLSKDRSFEVEFKK